MPDNHDRFIVHNTPLGRVFVPARDEAPTPNNMAHPSESPAEPFDGEIIDLPAGDVTVVDTEGPPHPEERFVTRATTFANRFFHRPDPERERMRQATRQAIFAQLEEMESDLERYLRRFDASSQPASGDAAAPTSETTSALDPAARAESDATIDLDEPTGR